MSDQGEAIVGLIRQHMLEGEVRATARHHERAGQPYNDQERRMPIHYSEMIKGDRGNHECPARFDLTGGYLGITQIGDGQVKDRVLLSPNQVKELTDFIGRKGRRRERGAAGTAR